MCGRFYLDTIHVDRANLIMRYLLIRWFDLKTGHTITIMIKVTQEGNKDHQISNLNAIIFFFLSFLI